MYTIQLTRDAGGRSTFIDWLIDLDERAGSDARAKQELAEAVARMEALKYTGTQGLAPDPGQEGAFVLNLGGRSFLLSRAGRQLSVWEGHVSECDPEYAMFWDDLVGQIGRISEDEAAQIRSRVAVLCRVEQAAGRRLPDNPTLDALVEALAPLGLTLCVGPKTAE